VSVRLFVLPAAAIALMALGGAHRGGSADATGAVAGRLGWPIRAPWVLSQPYGCTAFLLEPAAAWCATGHFHGGIDMAASMGTPVFAAAGGVVHVGQSPAGYGLYVLVDRGDDVATLYGHLSAVDVTEGALVTAGDRIGEVGSSGFSTGPHLHFEVRRAGRPVDPQPLLPAGAPHE
jgi:murein DD-endopeptidase MepM/ murein hydrolase activator NlpD